MHNLPSRPWCWQGKCFPRMSKTLTEQLAPGEREGVTWQAGIRCDLPGFLQEPPLCLSITARRRDSPSPSPPPSSHPLLAETWRRGEDGEGHADACRGHSTAPDNGRGRGLTPAAVCCSALWGEGEGKGISHLCGCAARAGFKERRQSWGD